MCAAADEGPWQRLAALVISVRSSTLTQDVTHDRSASMVRWMILASIGIVAVPPTLPPETRLPGLAVAGSGGVMHRSGWGHTAVWAGRPDCADRLTQVAADNRGY